MGGGIPNVKRNWVPTGCVCFCNFLGSACCSKQRYQLSLLVSEKGLRRPAWVYCWSELHVSFKHLFHLDRRRAWFCWNREKQWGHRGKRDPLACNLFSGTQGVRTVIRCARPHGCNSLTHYINNHQDNALLSPPHTQRIRTEKPLCDFLSGNITNKKECENNDYLQNSE